MTDIPDNQQACLHLKKRNPAASHLDRKRLVVLFVLHDPASQIAQRARVTFHLDTIADDNVPSLGAACREAQVREGSAKVKRETGRGRG